MAPLAPGALAFVDLETSGANFATDRIIEIGLVTVDGEDVQEWSVLVNPERPISAFITGLTGIDDAMLAPAATFRELAPTLLERLRGRLFIAHNARFDYGFLKGEFQRIGIDFRTTRLCTVQLSRKLFPEHHRHNLDTLLSRHGLSVAGERHRALADARALWDIWQCWHRQLLPTTIQEALAALLGRPELPPRLDPASIDELPEAPGAYALYGEDGRVLSLKRCGNLRRQVLGHFAEAQSERFRDTCRIDWRAAAGDFGARLGEIALTRAGTDEAATDKRRAPADELCSWQLRQVAGGDFRPRLVLAAEVDFARADNLFGLYTHRREALRSLRKLAEAQRLCLAQLGLEPPPVRHEACSAYRQKNCHGTCLGKETPAAHSVRLMTALAKFKLRTWPYPGAIVLSEYDAFGMRGDLHLIDHWRHLGTWHSEEALAAALRSGVAAPRSSSAFDVEIYHLVCRFLKTPGKVRIRPLPPATAITSA